MGREFDDEYRCVLAGLRETYGYGTDWIKCSQLAKREGNVDTVKKRYGIPQGVNGIDIYILARRKCHLAR